MAEGKDFATTGTESFKLSPQDKKKGDEVMLNIQEDHTQGVILEKSSKIRDQYTGNFITDIYHRINSFFIEHSGIKPQAKSQFFHLLAVMVNSGIPMIKALRSLALQTEDSPRLQYTIEDLAQGVEGGKSLSESMDGFEDIFTEQEVGMIQAGEASGQLSKVLDNLAKDTEKAYQIKGKVKSAMMYPMVVFGLLIVVIAAMMIFVVPKLKELFSSMGERLPLLTRVVLTISDFFVNYYTFMSLGLVLLISLLFALKKTDAGKYAFDKFKIRMPLFGKLFMKSYLSRFARSLSNLLDSNVTILKTLEISGNSIGNEVYRRRILLSLEDIKQGIPLAENLTDSDLFPPMMVNMIEVGEKTAQMPEITEKIADFYENEVDTAVAGISKIIEPVILIVIGVTVGTVVAAIMLPIMQLSDFAGSV